MLYTVSQKSEPPKHFATATANLHRFKWNFTYTWRHLFLSSTPSFIRIPYSVYEIFNSFKLLLQISDNGCQPFVQSLVTSSPLAGQWPSPPCPWEGCATVSWDSRLHQPTGLANDQSRSHYLNPVGHAIWGILQERVYRCQIRDVDHLKEWLIEEWRRFDQNIYTVSGKKSLEYFRHNFIKYWPIFEILLLLQSAGNLQ